MSDNSKQQLTYETKNQLSESTPSQALERVSKQDEISLFEESMFVVVSDSYAMSSQIVTTAELVETASDWARLLFGVIPENRLQECFNAARKVHKSSFAVSAYDLEAAYREIQKQSETGMEHYSAAAMENIRRVAEENRLHEEWRVKKIREEHDANRHNYRNAH